ncbi:AAA family ATPase [Streptomyces sp. NPDC050658]|uniref:helix-turn-helix transcriptional regulator n=1 Tax=unclassified Streptomyces TaxID=2593676 RepID=UPI0034290073
MSRTQFRFVYCSAAHPSCSLTRGGTGILRHFARNRQVGTTGVAALPEERERIISQLLHLLDGSEGRKPTIATLSGITAMGKSTLLHTLFERAESLGVTVLNVAGTPEDQGVPFAAFERLHRSSGDSLFAPAPTAAEAGPPGELSAAARETYRSIVELARRGSVLLTVDDIHYMDAYSLQSLRRLAQGHYPHPLAIVCTWNPPLNRKPLPFLEELLYESSVRRFRLDPLSPAEIAEWIERRCPLRDTGDTRDAEETAQEYHRLTGGSPLLVDALLTETAGRSPRPADRDRRVLQDAVLACLHRAGPLALRVARGIALLGVSADLHLLPRLIGVSVLVAQQVAGRLQDIGVLEGTRFRCPDVPNAVLDNMPLSENAALRHKAARLLHDDGASAETVARHLLLAGQPGEEWADPLLQEAAFKSLLKGEPDLAIRYLTLAGECCGDERDLNIIKVRTALIHWLSDPAAAQSMFATLRRPILAGKVRQQQAANAAEIMLWNLELDEAGEVLEHLFTHTDSPAAGPHEELLSLQHLVRASYPGLTLPVPGPARPGPDSGTLSGTESGTIMPTLCPTELRSAHALSAVLSRRANEHTLAQAEQVLQGAGLCNSSYRAISASILSLIYADRAESAAAWCRHFMDEAVLLAFPTWQGVIAAMHALASFRQGHLNTAATQAELALNRVAGLELNESSALALSVLADTYTAIGNHEAAETLFNRPVPPTLLQTRVGLHYLHARGRHQLAVGRRHIALADFTACGEHMVKWDIDSPTLVPWRAEAAATWRRLGRADRAAQLLQEQLTISSELDHPRARGLALRTYASISAPADQPALLEEALDMLQISGDTYETARVLADLSKAYQRIGERNQAQSFARKARRLAQRCHSDELRREVESAGLPLGQDHEPDEYSALYLPVLAKLSESERRVAILAAQGRTNREIAAKLYVTVSTIEQHLTRIYRKMNIRNREELPAELQREKLPS